MPQVTLVPWTTEQPEEFGTAWGFAGDPVQCLRAPGDVHEAGCGLLASQNDSNPLRGYQWRVAGSGAVFSWANKTITSVLVQVNVINDGPFTSSFWAFVTANQPLTYAEQVFNGEIGLAVGVPSWITLVNAAHAQIIAAILADNFMISIHFYNHSLDSSSVRVEAAQVVVTYSDVIPKGSMLLAMEA